MNSKKMNTNNMLRPFSFFAGILVLSIVGLFIYIGALQEAIVETAALENAKFYNGAIAEFRTLYTAEVVNRVRAHPDITVSHDYKNTPFAIPLPATLSLVLGQRIGTNLAGAETRLYSPYPFSWRTQSAGLKDPFAAEAWTFLNQHPDRPFYQFTQVNGRAALRYATADIMRPSCVQCHNTHPDSPKRDWQSGQVRGVLEIIHPLDHVVSQTASETRGMYFLAAIITAYGGICLIWLIRKFLLMTTELEQRVEQRSQALEKAQAQLIENSKMASIGEMAVNLAHEINQPLGAMKLSCEALKSAVTKVDQERSEKYADRIIKQVNRVERIVTQLNIFGRDDKYVETGCYDINDIITNALVLVEHQFSANGVSLQHRLAGGLSPVRCNLIEMESVLINLLNNARQAVESNTGNKVVTVESDQDDDHLYIRVEDNGCGIPDAIRHKIFDPFFTTKEIGKGTGIGLSMCYGIVHKYGGTIEIDPDIETGSRFCISMPKLTSNDQQE